MVHLLFKCTYSVEVWTECCRLLGWGPDCQWEGDTILDAWERWRRLEKVDIMKVIPLLVTWGIWLVRNNVVFNEKVCTPAITAGQTCGIALALPKHIRVDKQREILELEIDKSSPWGFFDGASQNMVCGVGGNTSYGRKPFFRNDGWAGRGWK